MKLLKIGTPRQPYRYVLNWGVVNLMNEDSYDDEFCDEQFCIWLGRHSGNTIILYQGKIRRKRCE